MTRLRVLVGILLAASLSLGAVSSRAADEDKSVAAQMFASGKERFKRKDYEGARGAFTRAYELDGQPKYLWDLALAEVFSDHSVEGLRHFRQYLSLPQITEDDRRKAQKAMAKAETKTAHIVLDVPEGTSVSADDQPIALYADHTLDLLPGKHTIEARSGTRTASTTIEANAGETVHPELRFEDPALAPMQSPAVAPPSPHPPPPPPATTYESPAPVAHATNARWIASGVLAGVGLVGLVTGGVFLVNSASEQDTASSLTSQIHAAPPGNCANATTPNCSALSDAAHAHATDQNMGTALVVGGAGLIAAGVVTWLVWPSAKITTTGQLAPLITVHGGGAQWVGNF